MWGRHIKQIQEISAQERVVHLLLERGFQVTQDGKVTSGGTARASEGGLSA
jgi:predicted regulator of amino acid metabolism with ACT domain